MTPAYAGLWTIDRSIVDHRAGSTIRCTGSARLSPNGLALDYDEAVSFELAGNVIRATRAYRFFASGDSIVATFTDGSPFFELRLSAAGVGRAVHRCADDDYALSLCLCESAQWRTLWDVTGTKRLQIITRYHRP